MIMQERITLKDIADSIGVTPAVVSHVLSGVKGGNIRVGQKKREEILNAAKRLDYVPHITARQMAKKRSFAIGVVLVMHPESIPSELSPLVVDYSHESMLGVESVCREYNYNCLINVQRINKEFELPRMMHDGSVDGVVIVGPSNEAMLKEFAQAKIYCVQVGSNVPREMGIRFVSADIKTKFCEVSEAFYRQYGSTRQMALLVKGPGPEEIGEYFVALQKQIPDLHNESMIMPSGWEKQHNRDILRGILTRPTRPEVVLVEPLYVGSLFEVADDLGLKIPEDLNVVTFGIESLHKRLENVYSRSIAMITFSIREVGRRATELLLKKFGDYKAEVNCLTQCDFVNGGTCRKLDLK